MLPFLTERFANPSGSHRFARQARRDVDEARDVVAAAIGCRPGEVVFTGGGTEADNTAIAGALARARGRAQCARAAEHHAVLASVEAVGGVLVGVRRAPGTSTSPRSPRRSADSPASVVSVMAVNNEVGTITDLAAVAALVRRRAPGAVLHTDAVQAPCWLDLPDAWRHVDVLVPVGATSSAARRASACSSCATARRSPPLLVGGGQERERRSGTHNVAGIVAHGRGVAAHRRRARGRGGAHRRVARPARRPAPRRTAGRGRDGAACRSRWPARRTCASRASRTRRCCTCSTRPTCAPRPRRRAPAAPWSPRTCWRRWACHASSPPGRCV